MNSWSYLATKLMICQNMHGKWMIGLGGFIRQPNINWRVDFSQSKGALMPGDSYMDENSHFSSSINSSSDIVSCAASLGNSLN